MLTKFCVECGSSIREEEQFCPSCGAKYISTESVEVKSNSKTKEAPAKQPRPIWKKFVYLLLFLIIAGGIRSHFYIKSITSPEATVESVYISLLNKDEKMLFENILISKDTDYNAQNYISYINDQQLDSFFQTLLQNVNGTHADGITRIIEHENGSELFRLKAEKFLFFYPIVKVYAVSSDVILLTDLKDAIFSFNKKEFPLDGDSIEIGSFLPGDYPVTATSSGEFVPHSADWSVFVSTSEDVNEVTLMKADTMITLDSDESDSTVYINGVSTKKTINDLKTIGPIFGDTAFDLYVEKKTPSGELITSYEEVGTAGSTLYFDFDEQIPEEITAVDFDKKKLEEFVLDFRESYSLALTEQDFEIIRPYLTRDSVAYEELVDFIGDLGDDYYEYDFTLNEVTGTEVTENVASVSMYEEFIFTNHKNETTHYERDKEYNILLNYEGIYEIYQIDIKDTTRNR